MDNKLWFTSPAGEYMEGLPIGNGRLAAMMLGTPGILRMALNHEWLWTGQNRHRRAREHAAHLPEVRQLLLAGDFKAGTRLANRYFTDSGGVSGLAARVDSYQPLGDIHLSMAAGEAEGYTRSLDIDTGLFQTRFHAPCGEVIQRAFISMADGCGVLRVTAERPADMVLTLGRAKDPACGLEHAVDARGLVMRGRFRFETGTSFAARLVVVTDGDMRLAPGSARITGARVLTVLVQAGTDACGEDPAREMGFPDTHCFDTLLARHIGAFRAMRGDASLELDLPESALPTDERLAAFKRGEDPALARLYFEYGRYLMVSGSSGALPLNLQGKWNESLTPPWDCDYHMDINLQMCYWAVETLGMEQAGQALFSLAERFVPGGRDAAARLYGCRGVYFPLATDVWGCMTPEAYGWAVWTGAAPWIADHFYRHWRYTKDIYFLRTRAYPFLKEVALFYQDYLLPQGGELVIVPSQSPENRFVGSGDLPVSIGCNCAMDIELAMDTLAHAAEAAALLDVDAPLRDAWLGMLKRLPKLSVDSRGRLNEWDTEREEAEPGHRHLSHLYGLYPSGLFEPDSALWRAAERSLDERLRHGGGHTGWSRAWVACLMARLGRGEDAWQHLTALIGDFATSSLLDLHPPRIFQIDGNLAGAAAVCEMLIQSRPGRLHLLPALPLAWPCGRARNFRAQDGVLADFGWREGALTSLRLTAPRDMALEIRSGVRTWSANLKAGETVVL